MNIEVRIDKNYGVEAIYPENDSARTFCQLTGKKTLSRSDIEHIKSLGFTVNVMAPAL